MALPLNYRPSDAEVAKYLAQWQKLQNYVAQEAALELLFSTHHTNTDVSWVFVKCTILNTCYSAGVLDKHLLTLAQKIAKIKQLDTLLQAGNWSAVELIRSSMGRDYYSFATKYCNFHNPEQYPIYDSFVEKVLIDLKDRNQLHSFKTNVALKDYSTFGNVLKDLTQTYALTSVTTNADVNFKLLDRYLWQLGKQYYGPAYMSTHKAVVGNYTIWRNPDDSIDIFTSKGKKDKVAKGKVKSTLVDIYNSLKIPYSSQANTRQLGKDLIYVINKI